MAKNRKAVKDDIVELNEKDVKALGGQVIPVDAQALNNVTDKEFNKLVEEKEVFSKRLNSANKIITAQNAEMDELKKEIVALKKELENEKNSKENK